MHMCKQTSDSSPAMTILAWGPSHHPPARDEMGYARICNRKKSRHIRLLTFSWPKALLQKSPLVQPLNDFTVTEA